MRQVPVYVDRARGLPTPDLGDQRTLTARRCYVTKHIMLLVYTGNAQLKVRAKVEGLDKTMIANLVKEHIRRALMLIKWKRAIETAMSQRRSLAPNG